MASERAGASGRSHTNLSVQPHHGRCHWAKMPADVVASLGPVAVPRVHQNGLRFDPRPRSRVPNSSDLSLRAESRVKTVEGSDGYGADPMSYPKLPDLSGQPQTARTCCFRPGVVSIRRSLDDSGEREEWFEQGGAPLIPPPKAAEFRELHQVRKLPHGVNLP